VKITGYTATVNVPNPAGGRGTRHTVGTFRTQKAAERAEQRAQDEVDSGTFEPPKVKAAREAAEAAREVLTVERMLTSWLAGLKAAGSVTSNTLGGYEVVCRKHVVPALGSIHAAKLTRADVRAYVRGMQEAGKGAQTQNRAILCLRRALDELVEDGVIAANPAARIKLPSPKQSEHPPEWSPENLRTFLAKTDADLIGAGWYLLAVEALRRGEMLGARWRDVRWNADESAAVLEITQTVAPDMENGGAPVIQGRTKTAAGTRNVQLTPSTVAALKRHRDRQAFARQKAGDAWQDLDLIACNEIGGPLRPDMVQPRFRKLVAAAQVPEMTVHQLRHSAISAMVRGGTPLALVAAKVGHADVAITYRTYSHLAPADQQAANDAMERFLATGTEGGK